MNWTTASICVDETDRIVGMNVNDLTGNTGWMPMPENLTGRTEQELYDYLTEEHGVPLYKVEGGAVVCRTQEEIAADIAALPAPEPAAVPATWDELARAYEEGVNEA